MADPGSEREHLTYDEVDLVLRRATELQHGDPTGEGKFSLEEVERLGSEIGLSSEAVRTALVHVRSGALMPVENKPRTLADRLVGPEQVVVQRRVRGPVAEVWERVNAFMREQLLVVRRNFGERVVWGPTEGIVSQVRRALDIGNQYTLRGAEEIETSVMDLPGSGGYVEVVLVARFAQTRRDQLQGGMVGAGILLAAGAVGAVFLLELALVASIAAAAGGVGLSGAVIGSTRRKYLETVGGVRTALERLLDALEHER